MGRKWPKMAENGPKIGVTENDQKRPKMAKNGRKMAENGPKMDGNGRKWAKKWPKMTKNGQKWPKVAKSGQNWPENGRKWPTMAKMAIFWLFGAIVDHFWSFLPIFPIFEGAPLGAVGSTAPITPAIFGARPTKQAAGLTTVL